VPPIRGAGADLFAAILSPDLTRLEYAVRIGGSGQDRGRSAAFGPDGTCYIGGDTGSADWPARPAAGRRPIGKSDGIVVAVRPPAR
ncbi:MAG TPA: hypothetical protein VNK43_06460, partial [Gemmatimonadales bacterium]|nr:hypothetical protein [Gemmatimonadales bacterium]